MVHICLAKQQQRRLGRLRMPSLLDFDSVLIDRNELMRPENLIIHRDFNEQRYCLFYS